jgi:hypothetical protein
MSRTLANRVLNSHYKQKLQIAEQRNEEYVLAISLVPYPNMSYSRRLLALLKAHGLEPDH